MLGEMDKTLLRFSAYIVLLEQEIEKLRASLSEASSRINDLQTKLELMNGKIDSGNQS